MIQVMCRLEGDREMTALTTDSSDRAAQVAHALHVNGHYAEIFVQIGHQRFAYSDFIKLLEKV